MHLSAGAVNGHDRNADQFYLAVVETAFQDVLQRSPTPAELEASIGLDVSFGKNILSYYKDLLCSSEFIDTYVLTLPLLTLARLLINQIAGRAPHSQDEIGRTVVTMIEAGWLSVVRNMLQDLAVQQRIFFDIQRAARDRESDHRPTVAPDSTPATAQRTSPRITAVPPSAEGAVNGSKHQKTGFAAAAADPASKLPGRRKLSRVPVPESALPGAGVNYMARDSRKRRDKAWSNAVVAQ